MGQKVSGIPLFSILFAEGTEKKTNWCFRELDYTKLFEFLRYCLDEHQPMPECVRDMEWKGVFAWAERQAILGVIFNKIQNESNIKMPRELLLKWLAVSEQIKQRNTQLNKRCVELTELLQKEGFRCCVLKGQGNAAYYPNPYSRTPGDIDIYLTLNYVFSNSSQQSQKEKRKKIIQYVREHYVIGELRYYHVEFETDGVPVELHFMPCITNNPVYNRRLQRWFDDHAEIQRVELLDGVGQIPVPTWEFNVVYQLAHLMHHFFDEGIGLRQFVDYFYLLKGRTEHTEKTESTLRHLGLWKFAGAVMYVMREVFALEEQYMIVPVDERRGKTLLNEILKGGNFGQHSGLTNHSTGGKYFAKTWRNMKLVREYPAEALCEPVFRTWHFFWRLAHR